MKAIAARSQMEKDEHSRQYHYRQAAQYFDEAAAEMRKAREHADRGAGAVASQHAAAGEALAARANQHVEEAPKHRIMTAADEGERESIAWLKLLIPVVLVLLVLLAAVLLGTTGDLTQTWNLENLRNSVLYPRSP